MIGDIYNEIVQDKNGKIYLLSVEKEEDVYYGNLYQLRERSFSNEKSLDNFIICGYAGFFLLEKLNDKDFDVSYTLEQEYQGKGLGSKLIECSKKVARMLGGKKLRLSAIRRMVDHPNAEGMKYNANVNLYLSKNFSIDNFIYHAGDKWARMSCDLEKERDMSMSEYYYSILENKSQAYLKQEKRKYKFEEYPEKYKQK